MSTTHDHSNMDTTTPHDHSAMTTDHSGHGDMDMGGMDMTMSMFFHTGKDETVLFEFWKTEKTLVFIASLIIIFLMAFSYEALKYGRDLMFKRYIERSRSSFGVSNPSKVSLMLSGFHVLQTLLHMVQFVLSYFLMLIFMTYNVWLAVAVTLGAGTGYFFFGQSISILGQTKCVTVQTSTGVVLPLVDYNTFSKTQPPM